MRNSKKLLIVGIILFCAVLAISNFWLQEQYLLLSILLIAVSMAPFLVRYEAKKLEAKEVVLVAMLSAIAAVSRVPFAALPSIQPTSFVVIMTGVIFGSETGFMVGATAAISSNIFLGQGPWTPWQMFAWGLMGLTAGLLKTKSKSLSGRKWSIIALGLIWGFLFGWIMDLSFVFGFIKPVTWEIIFGAFLASIYFNIAHAASNIFFLSLFSNRWIKIMQRVKLKFGLLE